MQKHNLLTMRQLLLIIVNATKNAYVILFKKWWWLYCLCVLVDICYQFPFLLRNESPLFLGSMGAVWFFVWCLFGYVVFMTMRTSIDKKDYRYYCQKALHGIVFLLYTALAWLFRIFFCGYITMVYGERLGIALLFKGMVLLVGFVTFLCISYHTASTIYMSPFMIFLVLFLLDAPFCLKNIFLSIKRALYMVVTNFFVCVTVFVITLTVFVFIRSWVLLPIIMFLIKVMHITGFDHGCLALALAEDIGKIMLLFPLCAFVTLYNKKVHEQCLFYFNQ